MSAVRQDTIARRGGVDPLSRRRGEAGAAGVASSASVTILPTMDSAPQHPHDPVDEPTPAVNIPPVTLAAAGVLVAAFALLSLGPPSWTATALQWFAVRPVLIADAVRDPVQGHPAIAALSLVGHALIHLDLAHVALNVGFLLAFGGICERVFGPRRFAAILVLSAVAGAGAKLAVDWNAAVYMIGASGAVFGCMGAFIRLLIGGPPVLRRRGLALLLGLVAVNALFTFIGPSLFGLDARIAWDAHVGGFVAGFLLGWRPPGRALRVPA